MRGKKKKESLTVGVAPRPLFYCCICLQGTYERNNLLWDDDLEDHWPEGGNEDGHHCIHEWNDVALSPDGKYRKEIILAHLLED